MNKEFFEAVALMEKEKGIQAEYLYDKISEAIVKAVRKDYNNKDVVACDIDPEAKTMRVYIHLNIVEELEDWDTDILVEDAIEYRADAKAGETLEIDLDTMKFGRIAAQTAKHVIRQGIKDAERGQIIKDFQSKTKDLISAKVGRIDPINGNVTLEIGKGTAVLPKAEQVPGETFTEGQMIKVYISEVKETERGPRIMISRTHAGLVRRLFEQEVPEIYDGIVAIHSVSREAGIRTKMAVSSKDENVDPIGACIGQRGARVNNIVEVLGGEKIDIVKYSEDPAEFIGAALAPANVLEVEIISTEDKKCQVTVPDHQLSLAIGNKGLNAKLAAKLTGWKIDIKPESGFYEG
ncbi:MAG: transcription termination/antitermination protein NusA [Clostridia bacterium]|nr:transcription termination/antitermination protein NusA [Clostridia bacterium]